MGKQIRFFSENLHFSMYEDEIEAVIINDIPYFLLEPLMDVLQTYVFVNGDGNLYYNSVPENKLALLEQTERIMAQSYYSADYLDDLGILADAALGVAAAWDIVVNLRFDYLWGEAYQEDLRDQFLKMMLPIETSDVALMSVLNRSEDLISRLSGILKLGDQGIDALAELTKNWDKLPKGTWELLFGSDELTDFEQAVFTADDVVSGDVFEQYILSLYASSDAKDYQAVKDAMNKGKGFDVEIFSLSDLLSVGTYFVSTTQACEQYVEAVELVTKYYSGDQYPLVVEQAKQVSADCRNQLDANSYEILGRFTTEIFETMPSNIAESSLQSWLLPNASLITFATRTALEGTMQLDSKTQAVRVAALCTDIQQMFTACYYEAVEDNINSNVILAAMQMYLRCAWQSIDAFSFDEELSLSRIKSCIENDMALLYGFDKRLFSVKENDAIYSEKDLLQEGSVQATDAQIEIFEMLAAAVFAVTDQSDQFLYGYESADDLTMEAKQDAINMLIMLWAGDRGKYMSIGLHVDDLNQFTDALFGQTIYQVKEYPEDWYHYADGGADSGMDPGLWTILYPGYVYEVEFRELRMEGNEYVVTCDLVDNYGWAHEVTFRAVRADNLVGYRVLNAQFRDG